MIDMFARIWSLIKRVVNWLLSWLPFGGTKKHVYSTPQYDTPPTTLPQHGTPPATPPQHDMPPTAPPQHGTPPAAPPQHDASPTTPSSTNESIWDERSLLWDSRLTPDETLGACMKRQHIRDDEWDRAFNLGKIAFLIRKLNLLPNKLWISPEDTKLNYILFVIPFFAINDDTFQHVVQVSTLFTPEVFTLVKQAAQLSIVEFLALKPSDEQQGFIDEHEDRHTGLSQLKQLIDCAKSILERRQIGGSCFAKLRKFQTKYQALGPKEDILDSYNQEYKKEFYDILEQKIGDGICRS